MTLRKILVIPDPLLRQVAEPVHEITSSTKSLIKDMFATMYDAPGIGLAAPQIGIMQRIIVVDCATRSRQEENGQGDEPNQNDEELPPEREPDPEPIAMINPQIYWFSEEKSVYEEGCLSIPEYYEDVERPSACSVRYLDERGKTVERQLEGLLSTCVQHEVDHLDGKLFIDYISRLKRERITKKFQKVAKRAAS